MEKEKEALNGNLKRIRTWKIGPRVKEIYKLILIFE